MECWDKLIPILEAMGLLTLADGNALSRYCRLWARWVRAEEFIVKYGETYPLKDKDGNARCFMQHPQVGISHRLSAALTKLEAEYGLTPAARVGLKGSKQEVENNGKSRFFGA